MGVQHVADVITPYFTAMPYINGKLQEWVDTYDSQRLGSYDLYDDMYDSSPASGTMLLRGASDKPIHVPTAKRVVNTLARYVGRGWGFAVDPTLGTDAQRAVAAEFFKKLFVRERVLTQFNAGKKELLRRGDWVWMLQADPDKRAGRRISIKQIDPRTYFPILDDDDLDRVTGARIIEQVPFGKEDLGVKVQRWLKHTNPEHEDYGEPDPADEEGEDAFEIMYECIIYDIKDWDDPEKRKVLQVVTPLDYLDEITTVPLYHVKLDSRAGNPFGRSILAGLESVMTAINQAVTDEDLALAMAGLGMFVTDAGRPVDEATGQTIGWVLGPEQVIQTGQGKTFKRIDGITSVEPQQTHIKYLENQSFGTFGVNDVALGVASSPESGIALSIKMQPLFDTADEIELAINEVLDQMFHDIADWAELYEDIDLSAVRVFSKSDPSTRIPFDRAGRWTELMTGLEKGIFSLQFVHTQLQEEFGYEIPSTMMGEIQAAASKAAVDAAAALAAADPYGDRVSDELNSSDDPADGA
jgi:hypothetical protein